MSQRNEERELQTNLSQTDGQRFDLLELLSELIKKGILTDTQYSQEPVSLMSGINRRVQLGPGYCFVLLVADRESVLIVLVTRLCECRSQRQVAG